MKVGVQLGPSLALCLHRCLASARPGCWARGALLMARSTCVCRRPVQPTLRPKVLVTFASMDRRAVVRHLLPAIAYMELSLHVKICLTSIVLMLRVDSVRRSPIGNLIFFTKL